MDQVVTDVTVNDIPVLNPSELEHGRYTYRSRITLFKMYTNAGDKGYVWSNDVEDAFEEWVEYLDDASPGVFETVDEDDLKESAKDLGLKWKKSWPDWNDPDFEKVVEHAEEDLDSIGHTTLNSGTHIPKDAWSLEEILSNDKEYSEVWCASAKAYFADNGYWPDKPSHVKCPDMDGWPLVDDLDGVRPPQSVPAWIRRGGK